MIDNHDLPGSSPKPQETTERPGLALEADLEVRYQRFVSAALNQGEVYVLSDHGNTALSTSVHFTNSEDEPCPVICVWSSQALANAHRVDDWAEHAVKPIPLVEFLENWLLGMSGDEVVAGVEFDQNLFGKEEDPLVLARDLAAGIAANGIEPEFRRFSDLAEYQGLLAEILGED